MERSVIMNLVVNSYLFAAANKPSKALLILAGLFLFSIAVFSQENLRGVVLENDRYDRLPLPFHYGKVLPTPRSVDLKPFLPRVITQTSSNSAVAWSAVWYGHTILEAKKLNLKTSDLKHRALPLSPAFSYRAVSKNPGCNDAVSMIDLLSSFQRQGAPRFSTFPEFCVDEISTTQMDSAKNHKLDGYGRLFNTYDSKDLKVQETKKALHSGSPVILGFICPPSFQYATEFWQPREIEVLKEYGAHAVCIVGFDDQKFGGAFEVVNSWGPHWGNKGTTWFRYDDFAKHALYGFQLMGHATPFRASVTFTDQVNNVMPVVKKDNNNYTFTQPYSTGQKLRASINTTPGVFFSMLVTDAAKQSAQLFPLDTLTSPFVAAKLVLPNEAEYFELTEPRGRNYLHFVFAVSEAKLKESIAQVLKGEKILTVDPKKINWDDKSLLFESKESLVVVTVELIQR